MILNETEALKSLFQMRLRVFSRLPETRGFNEGALVGLTAEGGVKLFVLYKEKWTEIIN